MAKIPLVALIQSWSHSSFALPETATPFRASLIRFFTALLVPTPTPSFLSLPQGVELRLPFTPLDNQTPGRPTIKLPCPQWSIPTVGWFLSFITTGAIQIKFGIEGTWVKRKWNVACVRVDGLDLICKANGRSKDTREAIGKRLRNLGPISVEDGTWDGMDLVKEISTQYNSTRQT
ncbi:hypothetical protein AVEN_195108-1 [Araneus ventricosus]|uniref:Uncharacterized protein n=1 Tax=Araneus ventricosus TaxID=182803 RepID=A0A4Y2BJ82_ARAVE|nr:hypothetical protein AVEN_195108-1 [Araneus ventricosus]